jgi:hypothetical protein
MVENARAEVSKGNRIVTQHVLRRRAHQELGRLLGVQEGAAKGVEADTIELRMLELDHDAPLKVRPERHRFYKWAVVTPLG